jgi:hypothetical protein
MVSRIGTLQLPITLGNRKMGEDLSPNSGLFLLYNLFLFRFRSLSHNADLKAIIVFNLYLKFAKTFTLRRQRTK